MPTASVLDLNALLAPIGGETPAGSDPRQDSPTSPYFKVKDARAAARAIERSMDADDETGGGLLAEWRTILDISPKILQAKAKDLEVTAWYIEALLRQHGFAGLRDGFLLAAGLVDAYWDGLFPLPDEDEERIPALVSPFEGLNGASGEGTLIQPIRKVTITRGSEKAFAYWQYEQALEVSKITDASRKQARIAAGAVSWEDFEKSVRETDARHFQSLVEDLEGCLAAFETLNTVLDAKAGRNAPPAGNIRSVLNAVLDAVRYAARDKLALVAQADADAAAVAAAAPAPDAAGAAGPGAASAAVRTAVAAPGPLATREDAFRLLLQVADFFRRNEPHSPISYTLEEVVRRGRLPLPDLLQELITDDEKRRYFFIASGIKPPETAEQS